MPIRPSPTWVTITRSPHWSPTPVRRRHRCRRNSPPTCLRKRCPRYAVDPFPLGRLTTMIRAVLAIGCVCWLSACASAFSKAAHPSTSPSADIGRIGAVKSSFGPEFHLTNVAPTGIDPKLLTSQKLPEGLKFEPADCAKLATAQGLPPGVQGNMAAVVAEGDGNRYIAIAVQTSKPVPFHAPGPQCQKVGFGGGPVRGLVEAVDVPQISGTQTLGVHRIVETTVDGKPSVGEIYY